MRASCPLRSPAYDVAFEQTLRRCLANRWDSMAMGSLGATMILPEELASNSSFSRESPGLQLAVDSTSLGAFKNCPRYYYLSIIWGWEPQGHNVHLTFGLLIHGGVERYHHARASGGSHEAALDRALDWALCETWRGGKPWTSGDPNKNRFTFIRSLVWYLDTYKEDFLKTALRPDGRPAVELSFSFDSGYRTQSGETILFCGHLDRLAQRPDGALIIPDVKTSKRQLDPRFWGQFAPNNQMALYDMAGQLVFETPTQAIVIDGMQVLVGETRFGRWLLQRTDAQRQEWLAGQKFWLAAMEHCAQESEWPMNERGCDAYGGCQFRGVCSRAPGARDQWLRSNFQRRVWDPLQKRGDI